MWGLCYDPESNKAAVLGHFPENQETLNTSWVSDDVKAQSINFVTFDTSFVVRLKKVLAEIHKEVFWASQVALMVKNPSANAGDLRDVDSVPGSGRPPGGGNGNPLQYSCLENPMDRGAWWATVHWVTKSLTWLKYFCASQMHSRTKKHLWMKYDASYLFLKF